MTCQDRDQDLLLYGLGNLSPSERWRISRHLRSCVRCRRRLRELTALSGQIAAALTPPTEGPGPPGGPGKPMPAGPLFWHGFAPLILVVTLSLLSIGLVGVWFVRSHALSRHATRIREEGCRPDLLSDKCR